MYGSRFVVRAVPVRGVAGWRSLGVLPRSRGASDVSSDVKPRSGEIWRPAAPHALIPFSLLERGTARATCLRPLSVVAVERLRISPARLARTHRTGRTHSLVLFLPPTSLFAQRVLDEIHTSACARRCAHGSSWCTRCRPATSSSRCSCSLPWRWQVVELDPQRPTALLARLSPVECGKLDALVKVAWWCKRQQRIPAEQPAAKGRTLPAMAAAIAPTAAVTRQVRV